MKTTRENTWPTSLQNQTPSSVFLLDVPKTFRVDSLRDTSKYMFPNIAIIINVNC